MPYNKAQLIQLAERDQRLKYLFFWGHTPATTDQVTKACLSQWYESSFEIDGIIYRTAEHWMMDQKARLFDDEAIRSLIQAAEHPGEAKKLGRKVKGFDPQVWDEHKMEIVIAGNQHKFSQNAALGDFLRQTQERILVEASPVDAIWGIGLAQDHPNAEYPARWPGENLLGFVLMEVRNLLNRPV